MGKRTHTRLCLACVQATLWDVSRSGLFLTYFPVFSVWQAVYLRYQGPDSYPIIEGIWEVSRSEIYSWRLVWKWWYWALAYPSYILIHSHDSTGFLGLLVVEGRQCSRLSYLEFTYWRTLRREASVSGTAICLRDYIEHLITLVTAI